MTAVAQPQGRDTSSGGMNRVRAVLRDYPIVPLLILLGLLVAVQDIQRPGVVDLDWIGGIVRNAIPLAILAACQTLTMLTGGIDPSVAQIAPMSGVLVATLAGPAGLPPAGSTCPSRRSPRCRASSSPRSLARSACPWRSSTHCSRRPRPVS